MRARYYTALLMSVLVSVLVSGPAGAQSTSCGLEFASDEHAEGAQDTGSAGTMRLLVGCRILVTVWFNTTDPNLDGKSIIPQAINYNQNIINVDRSPDPTAVWNGDDADWIITGRKAGTTTISARDPITGSTTDPTTIIVAEVSKAKAEYRMTSPTRDLAISGTGDNELWSFWVVRSGQYKNQVRLKAEFSPTGDRPACFKWTWSGPADGAEIEDPKAPLTTMRLFKPGTYTVRAGARAQYKQIKVHAIQVTKVEWKEHVSHITSNPGTGLAGDPGEGKRIFPGKSSPWAWPDRSNGEEARKVKVEATIKPKLRGVYLHFRNFDVDDPSWNAGAADSDKSGNDNRGGPKRGDPEKRWRKTNSSGKATLTVRLPRQPGDNLVCGVATTSETKNRLGLYASIYIKDGKGRRILPTAPTPVAGASPLLTIWRKAHIEIDHMTNVTGNSLRRRVTRVFNRTATRTRVTFNAAINDKRGDVNRFENGRMVELGSGGRTFSIRSNNTAKAIVAHAAGDANRPRVGTRVDLFDDDVLTGAVPKPDTDWLAKHFRHCFIVPMYDLPQGTARFVANYDAPTDSWYDISQYYEFNSLFINDDSYWAVYLLGAYQYDYDEDLDPDAENSGFGTLGIVDDLRGFGASVFFETTNEWPEAERPDSIKYTTAHEIFHLWGARHEDGGFIEKSANMHKDLDDMSVRRIRSTFEP